MNDTINSIMTRYSCRRFTDRIPSDEDLKTIAKCAVAAPSGMNRQAWRIIVVKNRTLIDEMEAEGMKMLEAADKSGYERIMSRGGRLFYNSPCMVVIATQNESPGIVTENIALSATSLGINSLICGLISFSFAGEKGAEFKEKLGFPEGYGIGIAVLLGYEAEPGKPHEPDMDKISFVV